MDVDDLFGPGVLVRYRDHAIFSLLRGHPLGRIAVPSGALRIGDAYDLRSCAPIDVPAGDHEVVFAASEMDGGHDGAGLLVRVRRGAVARWKTLHAVGIDGATIGISDAEAKVSAQRLAAFERPLGAGRLGRSIAVASIGSDGGYPLRAGLDARGRLVALAVTAKDPRAFVRFPRKGSSVPPVDATSLDACLAWARAIGGDEAIVRAGRTDLAPLRAIRPLPSELRHYYATHTPYLDGDHQTFLAIVARHGLGRALPVAVNGDDALIYLAEDGRVVDFYEGSVLGQHLDLRAWVLLSTVEVHDLRNR